MRLPVCLSLTLLWFLSCNTTSSKIAFSKEQFRVKNESVLYVYRSRAFVGGGMETVLFFDGRSVGVLPQNGYFPIHALAGAHTLKGCSASLVAPEECSEIRVAMPAQNFKVLQLVMQLTSDGPRVSYVPNSDVTALEETRNEGNYHDVKLRDLLPKAEQRVILSAEKLGLSQSTLSTMPLQVALIDFTDETNSQLYTWLSGSIPDAIDQSMRRDFEYKRQQTAAKATLVISGSYSLVEKDKIRILARIFLRDAAKVLATESIDAPVNAELFYATKILSDRLVRQLHQLVSK